MRLLPAGFLSARFAPLALGCAFLLATSVHPRLAAAPNELGRPVVRDFPPGKSGIGHLSPAVTQDHAGFVYIANFTNVRCFDGSVWHPIPLPSASAGVRQFAVTTDGIVYLAGSSVIGYLRGAGANAEYISLADRLPLTATGCDDLYEALAVGNTVYFADEEKILLWRAGRFTVIPCPTPPHSHGARLHRVGDTVYVTALDHALYRLARGRLEVVADDPVLRQNQIIAVEAGPAGSLSLLTAERGFFQLAGGRIALQPLEANRWLAGRTILRAQRLGDRSLAVAFTSVSGDGGMRFNAAGQYVGPIDNSIGLYVKTLRGFFCDREGGLWIGSETGVFRLEWPSAVTLFDGINGLGRGAVVDVVRHEGALYAATTEGVYRLAASDDVTGRGARFERVLNHPAYSLVAHPCGLFALGYADLFVQTTGGFTVAAKLPPGGGSLQRSRRDPDRVWINTSRGLQSMRFAAGEWRDEGPAPGGADFFPEKPGAAAAPVPLPQLVQQTAGAIARTWRERDHDRDVLWICGLNGLVRVDLARGFPAPVPFATLLNTTDVREGDRFASENRTLKFEYVALRHQLADSVLYQTRLLGRDRGWSPWAAGRETVLSDLPAGDYRFEVRARDADGLLAAPAALGFVILPPWWRTLWAFLAYGAGGVGLITGVVRFRTRTLRQRAGQLEVIVAERTAELAQKNTELIRLHQLELDEKIAARLAEEKARLEVLRYQLNPHFLFNTLASISASLPVGRSTARLMVERLAEFCRLTLHRPDDRDRTTLGEEIQLLRAYFEIEQSRWGDLLDVEIVCDPTIGGERLPHFLLLPLVENALKYGRATSPDRVGVRLSARRDNDGALVLEVANTGEWVEFTGKKKAASLGIGLENLRERLARHYPRAHQLTITPGGGWVTVVLRILARPAS